MFKSVWDYYVPEALDHAIAALEKAVARGYRLEAALDVAEQAYMNEAGRPPSHLRGHLHMTWRHRRRKAGKPLQH